MAIRIKTFSHNVSSFFVAILWTDKLIIYAEESRFELKLSYGLKDLTFVDSEYIYAWGNSDIYRIRIFEDGPVVFRHLQVHLPTVQDKFQSLLNSDQKRKSEEIKTLQVIFLDPSFLLTKILGWPSLYSCTNRRCCLQYFKFNG